MWSWSLSDVSMLSKSSSGSGGSSGYLGSASSGVSGSSGGSGRSRLSIMPEMRVEPHRVVSPLPKQRKHREIHSDQDSMSVQVGSQLPHVKFVDENDMSVKIVTSQKLAKEDLDTIDEEEEPGPSGRKRKKYEPKKKKESEKAGNTPSRKKLSRKKRKSSTPKKDETGSQAIAQQEKIPVAAELLPEPESGLGVGSRVFARWVDGSGVYFYSAVVVAEEEARLLVRFTEDQVDRWVAREGETILVAQLSPGDNVTVKHDLYEAYEVTATLMSFPSRDGAGQVQYELAITARDSEPG